MPRPYSVSFDRNVPIPMRDGTILLADLYRPTGVGRYPVILQRTPYSKASILGTPTPLALRAAGEGYAVVVQDTRGRFESEGAFHCFFDERQDGYDTCAWITEQPWSNGRIGMFGQSYVGATQWQAALSQPPGLQTIVPGVTTDDYHEGWTYQGGAFELSFGITWALANHAPTELLRRLSSNEPGAAEKSTALTARIDRMKSDFDRLPLSGDPLLADLASYYDDWLAHPSDDDYWAAIRIAGHYNELDLPVLNFGAWYDIFLGGTIRNYQGMKSQGKTERARNAAKLVIGPWEHMTSVTFTPTGEYNAGVLGSHDAIDFNGQHLRWYDRWLRDIENGIENEPAVTIFVMGENYWRQESDWPIPGTVFTDYFLSSGGSANTSAGDGKLTLDLPATSQPDHYTYDPLDPVPTNGGSLCCNNYWAKAGVFDQSAIETRPDVLCYTGEPVSEPVELTGPVTVLLWAASSAIDTDFTAKLVVVEPGGYVQNLTDGIIRARYRNSKSDASPLTPGEIYPFEIDLWATSYVVPIGGRIRVEISSSNFPRFDRNPNHGGTIATATREDCLVARQSVFHGGEYPSRIVLPVVRGSLS